jgi:hypothetical protein
MQQNPGRGIARRMAVSGNVRPLLEHVNRVPALGEFARDDRSGKSGPRDANPHD